MAKHSSGPDSANPNDSKELDSQSSKPAHALDDPDIVQRKFYFINEIVEDKLRYYLWTSCTKVPLRDSIMSHANELIKQIIRKQNLHMIYPGQEESAFGDLVQTAWMQIERTLYKFRSKPHCRACYNPDRPMDSALYVPAEDGEYGIITFPELFGKEKNPLRVGDLRVKNQKCPYKDHKLLDGPTVGPAQGLFGGSESVLYRGNSKVFNMWSQVARTVILAFVKKECRDRKNAGSYRDHLANKVKIDEDRLGRFFTEIQEISKFNDDYSKCLKALKKIVTTDDKPHDGLIGKLVNESELSRAQVTGFIRMLRLRSHEFTDSPLSKEANRVFRHDRSERALYPQSEDDPA